MKDSEWDHPLLTEEQFNARVVELLLEAEEQDYAWWYCSFATPDTFLGGCYVRAQTDFTAVMVTHSLGINPGGEVLTTGPMPEEGMAEHVPEEKRWRLLTKEEIEE